MHRPLLAAAFAALIATPAFAADPVEGEWLVESGTAKVRIGPCAGRAERMCGVVSWTRDPASARAKDARNPDPALRNRTIMGLPMIRDFKPAAPGRWTGGKIYDPNTGKTYDSKMRVNGDGTLKVEGCVLVVCQAQTWRRG